MNEVYLLLGSNLSDRMEMLASATGQIKKEIGEIMKASSIYESESWGFDTPSKFLNQVLRVETRLNPDQVMDKILEIEKKMGRIRKSEGYSSRTIDIDILFFNDMVVNSVNLVIPHPRLQERLFTLIPLSEIDETKIHPANNKTVRQLIDECEDKIKVSWFSEANRS